jgi:acyl-homoserine-lactone acylase
MRLAGRMFLATAALTGGIGTASAAAEAQGVELVRTQFGVAHVTARDFTGLGYGQGFAQATDNLCMIANYLVTVRGERARYFGVEGANAANAGGDFFARYYYADATKRLHGMSRDAIDLMRGFVAGYNRVAAAPTPGTALECRDKPWLKPMTLDDMYTMVEARNVMVTAARNGAFVLAAAPPAASADARGKLSDAALAFADPDQADVGSNGWAFGRDATGTGSGLLLGNPHFPWQGENRFYQSHLTIPGKIDVMGGGLGAMPGISIGFNRDVAWTHTVSYAQRMTLFELKLVPGDSTRYLLDGKPKAMTKVPVTIDVRRADGRIEPATHIFYETVHGPVFVNPKAGIGWTIDRAFVMGDVSRGNMDQVDTWLAFARARSVADIRKAALAKIAIPWVNTLAADRHGNALYGDMSRIPNVTAAVSAHCTPSEAGLTAAKRSEIVILDGSKTSCNWAGRPRSPGAAVLPATQLPTTIRGDYVANANDSYWLVNARQPFAPAAPVLGEAAAAQGFRARMQLAEIERRLSDKGAPSGGRIDTDWVRSTLFSNRSYAALIGRDATVKLCRSRPEVRIKDRTVDLAAACDAIASWDGTDTIASRGSPLFREYWQRVADLPGLFAVPFNRADPVNTPRGLAIDDPKTSELLLRALGEAVLALQTNGFALDAPLGALQKVERNGRIIPVPGGLGDQGVLNAMRNRGLDKDGYAPVHGTSYLQIVGFDADGPVAEGIMSYDQATDPTSPYYSVQVERFSRGEIHRFPFHPAAIRSDPGYLRVALPDDPVLHGGR